MADKRTQQQKQHDKIPPGNGNGRQQDAQHRGAAGTTPKPGTPKRP